MKTEKSNKLRGTVLFTVVAVMALLIIFLTGTLALATASSNRAHKSYSSSQASYTAKTAISGFTEAMSRDSNVAKTVVSLGENGNTAVIYPEVRINRSAGGAVDKSVGLIGYWDTNGVWQDNRIIVEKIADDKQYSYNTKLNKWEKVDLVKVTATARVGKEESTVTAYIKKKEGEKSNESPSVPSGIKGFNTIGDGNFANGGRFTGGLGVGLKSNVKSTYTLHNACEIDTTLTFINGNVNAGTSTFAIDVHKAGNKPYSETIINGSLWVANGQDSSNPMVQLSYEMPNSQNSPGLSTKDYNYTQQQIPYLYVDGVLGFSSQCTLVAPAPSNDNTKPDKYKQPFNLFVGTLMANKNVYTISSADIYMMDEYTDDDNTYDSVPTGIDWSNGGGEATSTFVKGDNYFGNGSSSYLYEWTDSVYNKTENQNKSYGGNIYCNGRLHLANVANVDGDVRVKGDCFVDGTVTIKGNLVVGGTLHVNGTLTADRIFCDHVQSYSGGSASADETFTTVDNVLHVPEALQGVDLEAGVPKYEFPKRFLFVWDPSEHKDSSGKMMLLNGDESNDPYVLYYKWKEAYAPNMRIYMDTELRTFKYVYPDETFEEEGYELVGTVDSYINALLESDSFLRDALTTDIIEKFIDTDSAKYESELPVEDNHRKTWYYTTLQYIREDNGTPVFRNMSIETDKEAALYIASNDDAHKLVTDLPYYTRMAADGTTDTGDVTDDPKTIYSNKTGRIVTAAYASTFSSLSNATVVNGNVYSYSSFGQAAYPVNMEREAIYADATKNTKIVKTLTEVREQMNLDNLDQSYPSDVPTTDNHKALAEANIAFSGGDFQNTSDTSFWDNGSICGDCTISGAVNGKTININPKGKTIWVILDNVEMQNEAEIIVDLMQEDPNTNQEFEAGKVCFLIKRDLYLSNKNAIVNKKMIPQNGVLYEFDATEDWGMEFYGQQEDASTSTPASRIILSNESQITGAFKCPYTDFACTKNGKYAVKYTDEYGVDWSTKGQGQTRGDDLMKNKPPLIGNALFRNCIQKDQYGNKYDMNEFGMYYTACGQGGSAIGNKNNKTQVTTSEGVFDIIYFSGV